MHGDSKMALSTLPTLPSVNGNKDEKYKRLKTLKDPLSARDATTKKWVEANFTPI